MKHLALIVVGAAVAMAAPQQDHPDSAAVQAGQKLFVKSCSGCHGANAKGGRGPDLTTGNWRWGASDEEIQHNILNGIAGTQMPPFPLAEDEVRSIVAWLRSLRAGTEEPITGDAPRGRQLFYGAAGCSRCHMIGGRGGRLGPDLSTAGAGKKPSELRKAILDPDESLAEGFETVEVEFPGGRALRGVKKNDDAFSIQIVDEQERLHLLAKRDLAKITLTHKSLMPAAKIEPAQVEDLIAFLHNPQPFPALDEWRPSADFNVTFARLRNAEAEPENWLTYWGDLRGTHYSRLGAITPTNAASLVSKWTFQFGAGNVETSPLVVDGLMFVTGPLNDAAALDARTGQPIWRYSRRLPNVASQCTVMTNRGFGVLGDRLFLASLDAHLVALDAKTGNVLWDTEVADYRKGFSITHAPLALDGRIIVGVTSGECALTGFIDAYDASTGKRLWRVHSIPQQGDPARGTWSGDSADYGGSPTWMTGTYDAETDTLFWTTGNPGPDYDGTVRAGDNLYSCSVLALDPATGKLKWYFQFTPHDVHDWDATETPVLIDAEVRGEPRKLLIQANRNGFFYVLDRVTGKFLLGKPFALQTWARGLDDSGRPMVIPNTDPTPEGNYVCPDASGATNFAAPSYSPQTGLFYVTARDVCATYFRETKPPRPGEGYTGGDQKEDAKVGNAGSIRAIDPRTGDVRWNFPLHSGSWSAGVLSTAGGVVFASSKDGNLIALDARSGAPLWHYQTGGEIMANPITYSVDGKQYVAVASTSALFVFGLR
jgi:PQQ-dependent dehydrogenase (methanol/ethanol family)